ncbi:acetoacetate metabolism regulatory protein AtoC [Dissulfurispira thermophila]|uniref:Acetoacetate metabolism regulatory protein AtoC n=1 Tax=Dissulfurispira thermophila TaxID=2715679 RepID=A0A7G1GYH9_9BACT|nr:sigma-54 dependent transcriptional regulator [Dissulfurispira thermophila]BCB95248.1 acetoacetate metabolism regulatory protein AtoC [Dissulfurispira thermophila]
MINKVLIVEDSKTTRLILRRMLEKEAYAIYEAANGIEAINIFPKDKPDVVILDLNMPGMDGIQTINEIKKIDASIPVIVVTSQGDMSTAVETMKLGAYDFLVKPVEAGKLIVTVKRAIEKLYLQKEISSLHESVDKSLEWTLGSSNAMKKVIEQIKQVAQSDFSIIIQGETGTGKTFVANIIHNLSKRSNKPFIKIDLSAIPETLVESELFGYEKGAFTGAIVNKSGFLKIADGGTILIDELENLSPMVQSKLLSVVENMTIYPLGSKKPITVDVRIIAATNKDIKSNVIEKKFRDDLFYRLGEFIISLPPLRSRVEDIPFFAKKFIIDACSELNKGILDIDEDTIEILKRHTWPGNLRELKNVLRRAVLFSNEGRIKSEHLKFLIEDKEYISYNDLYPIMPLKDAISSLEKKLIMKALEIYNWNKTKVSAALQIDHKTLNTKIKEYQINNHGNNSQ